MAALQTFEIGKTYGGYTVEHRTACFVTFEGQKRRKIEVTNGVESAPVDIYVDGRVCKVLDIDAIEDAPPSDLEVFNPVTTDDIITITDGDIDLRLAAINEKTQNAVFVPVDEAKDPAGRSFRLVAIPVLQAILNKPTVPSTEAKPVANTTPPIPPVAVAVDTTPIDNFWTKYKFQVVPNFKPQTVEAYKTKTDSKTFIVGQTYEAPSGFTVKITSRAGDTIECATKFSKFTESVLVDDGGEFIRLNSDGAKLYAVDTPAWFYGKDFDPAFERERLERSLSRDCDRAANAEIWGLI